MIPLFYGLKNSMNVVTARLGTEIGLTEPQDTAATDLSQGNFIPDADPTTTTNPTLFDTDLDDIDFESLVRKHEK